MSRSKNIRPTPRRDAPRAKLATPARERPKVSVRLEPGTYENLLKAAEAARVSVTAEAERRLEKSFEPDPEDPTNILRDFARHIMRAFEIGGWSDTPSLTAEEWLKDPQCYHGGMVHAFEAMLTRHPDPRFETLLRLLHAIRSRLEEHLLAVNPNEERHLPVLDRESSRRAAKSDITDEAKDEG